MSQETLLPQTSQSLREAAGEIVLVSPYHKAWHSGKFECARVCVVAHSKPQSLSRGTRIRHAPCSETGHAATSGSPQSWPRTGSQPTRPQHTQRPTSRSNGPFENRGSGVEGLGRAHKSAGKCIYVSPNDTTTNHTKERDSVSRILNHGHGDCAINSHLSSFLCTRDVPVSDQPPSLTPPAHSSVSTRRS